MPKIPTNWSKLMPGDVVSFRYVPSDKTKPTRTHTILILNPKYPRTLKNGEKKFYINALKLEESNIKIFKNKRDAWLLLKRLGWVMIRSLKNEIYKLLIKYINVLVYLEILNKHYLIRHNNKNNC